MGKVVVITGGSKGLGYAAAKSFTEKGCKVYEISRRTIDNPRVVHVTGDVTDKTSVTSAINEVYAREGRIDILVCNAGTVLSGAIEFIDVEDIKKLMDVNFYGMVNSIKAVLPLMRKTGGRIVCLSSMAAAFPIPFQAYYSASKAAVGAFAFALANEVKEFGIDVCAVMPGDSNTDQIRSKMHQGDDVYSGRIERSVAVMEKDEKNGMHPDRVGQAISKIALKKRVKPYYAIGLVSKLEVFLQRLLPGSLVRKVVGLMYAK